MWLLKFVIDHTNCVYTTRTKKFGLVDLWYPLGHYKEGKYSYFMSLNILQGKDEGKRNFINDIRKDKRVAKIEIVGDLIFILVKELTKNVSWYWPGYNRKLIFPTPVVLKDKEYWEVASWDRSALSMIVDTFSKNRKGINLFKVQKFTLGKINNMFIPQLMPKLSPMQKKVFDFASERGYYSYPRKASMKKLAKDMKIHVTTFREHLKKAEMKLLPFLVKYSTG